MRINMKKTGKNLLVLLALLPGIILIIFPMYVTIVTAFKTPPRHPAQLHLFFKVCQLLFVQTQRDHMLPFPHRASSLPVISSRLRALWKNAARS